jgi:hypothetical protein
MLPGDKYKEIANFKIFPTQIWRNNIVKEPTIKDGSLLSSANL